MLNKPIEHYHAMSTIFGNCLATGKYTKGTSDPLATEVTDIADDPIDVDSGASPTEVNIGNNGAADASVGESSGTKPPRKRARVSAPASVDDDMLLPTITLGLERIASAIEKVGTSSESTIPAGLWDSLASVPGFDEAHLSHYYAYLCENVGLAKAFMDQSLTGKLVWVTRYVTKHFP